MRVTRRSLRASTRGAALVEFAIAMPVFIAVVLGIVTYGAWYLKAHQVQQAANDAARAALAGINASERATIAGESVAQSLTRADTLASDRATVAIDDDGAILVVRVRYDATDDPLFKTALIPPPATVIARRASIRIEQP